MAIPFYDGIDNCSQFSIYYYCIEELFEEIPQDDFLSHVFCPVMYIKDTHCSKQRRTRQQNWSNRRWQQAHRKRRAKRLGKNTKWLRHPRSMVLMKDVKAARQLRCPHCVSLVKDVKAARQLRHPHCMILVKDVKAARQLRHPHCVILVKDVKAARQLRHPHCVILVKDVKAAKQVRRPRCVILGKDLMDGGDKEECDVSDGIDQQYVDNSSGNDCSNVRDNATVCRNEERFDSCDVINSVIDEKGVGGTVEDSNNITDGRDEDDSHHDADDEISKETVDWTEGGQQAEMSVGDKGFDKSTVDGRDKKSCTAGDQTSCNDNSLNASDSDTTERCGEKEAKPEETKESSGSEEKLSYVLSEKKLSHVVSEEDLSYVLSNLNVATHQPTLPTCRLSKKVKSDDDNDAKDEVEELLSAEPMQGEHHWIVAMLKTTQILSAPHEVPRTEVCTGLEEEMKRLATFVDFHAPPGTFVLPIAESGFYLLSQSQGSQPQVECVFCKVKANISLFSGANAMLVHKHLSPHCRFVLGENVGNVSIAEVAKTSAALFVEKYSLPAAFLGNAEPLASESLPSVLPLAGKEVHREAVVSDSDGTAVVMPAVPTASPDSHPGSHLSHADRATGSSRGQTVADSRPARDPGQNSLHQEAGIEGTTSTTNLLYQTAVVSQSPENSQTAFNQTAGNQTAVIQTAGNQTAGSETTSSQTSVNQTESIEARRDNQPELLEGGRIPYQTATVSRSAASSGDVRPEPSSSTTTSALPGEEGQSTGTRAGPGEPGTSGNSQERQLVTYEQLGIYSQRPKRPDMAVTQVRINTFENWPHRDTHPPAEMAEAGFYYTGHDDLVRCFHCKGGLKTWDSSDKPWVEHSRWFPQCPFIKVCKGPTFVQAVKNLNNPATSSSTISEEQVLTEMQRLEDEEWRKVNQKGFKKVNMSPDPEGAAGFTDISEAEVQEALEKLGEENEELKNNTMCKMCQTNDVNVLFLPCGHLVSCSQCAPALRTCAMCRQAVKGLVRVHMDQKRDSEALNEAG